jgi:SAM-dependent methyltransferase
VSAERESTVEVVGPPRAAAERAYDCEVDDRARTGFSAAADAYHASRPGWPLNAVKSAFEEWKLDPTDGLVVDLAAGTGRLTEELGLVCPHVLAIEPVDDMRAYIRGADALAGTAEDMPLEDASALAVFVGEAFHWFDYTLALCELARVLRPGGGLAVLWNNPIPNAAEDELRRAIGELLKPYAYHPKGRNLFAGDPREERAWLSVAGWERFEPARHREFFHEQNMTQEELVRMVASWSFVAGLEEPVRSEALRGVDRLLAERGVEHHCQRWRCDVYLTQRR